MLCKIVVELFNETFFSFPTPFVETHFVFAISVSNWYIVFSQTLQGHPRLYLFPVGFQNVLHS